MLVDAVHRRVAQHGTVHRAAGVGSRQQRGQDFVPCAVAAVAPVPLPNRLPGTEFRGHITPGDPAPVPVPVDDALHDPAVIAELPAPAAGGLVAL